MVFWLKHGGIDIYEEPTARKGHCIALALDRPWSQEPMQTGLPGDGAGLLFFLFFLFLLSLTIVMTAINRIHRSRHTILHYHSVYMYCT